MENAVPLVSVIIPAYNHEAYIGAAIESVLAQSLADFELIVIDDGSADATATMAQGFAAHDPRVSVYRQENQGTAATLNRGLALARSRFTAILNSDDRFHPERLQRLVNVLEGDPGLGLAASNLRLIDPAGEPILSGETFDWLAMSWDFYRQTGNVAASLMRDNFICTTSNLVFRTGQARDIGGFAPLHYVNDLDFLLRLLAGTECQVIDEELVDYRLHPANTIKERTSRRAAFRYEMAWVLAAALSDARLAAKIDAGLLARVLADTRYYNLDAMALAAFMAVFRALPRERWTELLAPEGRIGPLLTAIEANGSREDSFARLHGIEEELTAAIAGGNAARGELEDIYRSRGFRLLNVRHGVKSLRDLPRATREALAIVLPERWKAALRPVLRRNRTDTPARRASALDPDQVIGADRAPDSGRIGILYVAPWVITGGSDQMTVDWFRELPSAEFDTYLVLTEPREDEWLPKVKDFAREVYDLPDLGIDTAAGVEAFILKLLERRRIRVVHVMHSAKGYAALPAIKHAHPEVRTVAQFHCFDILDDGRPGGYPLDVPRRYDSVIDAYDVVSEDLARNLRARHPFVPAKKMSVNRCVIDTAAFDPDRIEPDPAIMARKVDGALNILFVGRLDVQKNPLRMARVAKGLREAGQAAVFHVLGGGTLASRERELREFMAANGLEDSVRLHGVQPREAMPSWYAMADVLLMTSDWEGIPVVLFEAMAMGLPVVAPRIGGIGELVVPETGVLIEDMTDEAAYIRALMELAAPDLRLRFGAAARAHVRRDHDIGGLGRRYRDFYRKLLEEGA